MITTSFNHFSLLISWYFFISTTCGALSYYTIIIQIYDKVRLYFLKQDASTGPLLFVDGRLFPHCKDCQDYAHVIKQTLHERNRRRWTTHKTCINSFIAKLALYHMLWGETTIRLLKINAWTKIVKRFSVGVKLN